MPNHVHAVMKLAEGSNLSDVLHSLKSFTSRKVNNLLDRSGPFWQAETFDRLIRDERELDRTIRYVLNNPIKAGLRDWRWVGHTLHEDSGVR